MNKNAQNEAIALACGHPAGSDYVFSLDAMRRAEVCLTPNLRREFVDRLCDAVTECGSLDPNVEALVFVGPEIRARVFLQTLDRWRTA